MAEINKKSSKYISDNYKNIYNYLLTIPSKNKTISNKSLKKWQKLMLSLNTIVNQLEYISNLDEMLEKMFSLFNIDPSKHENKMKTLAIEYGDLKSELLKERLITCRAMFSELNSIKETLIGLRNNPFEYSHNPDDYKMFVGLYNVNETILNSSLYGEAQKIEATNIEQLLAAKEEREKTYDSIDKKYDDKLDINESVQSSYDYIEEQLASKHEYDIKPEIAKEFGELKRALPPTTIELSNERIQSLKKSNKYVYSMNLLLSAINNINGYEAVTEKSKKIAKKILKLAELAKSIVSEYSTEQTKLTEEQTKFELKRDYIMDASNDLTTVLANNETISNRQANAQEVYDSTIQTINNIIKIRALNNNVTLDRPIEEYYTRENIQAIQNAKRNLELSKSEHHQTSLPSDYSEKKERITDEYINNLYDELIQIEQEKQTSMRM